MLLRSAPRFLCRANDKGFSDYKEAYDFLANEVNKAGPPEEEAGVCAVVRIRLKQQIALTRYGNCTI